MEHSRFRRIIHLSSDVVMELFGANLCNNYVKISDVSAQCEIILCPSEISDIMLKLESMLEPDIKHPQLWQTHPSEYSFSIKRALYSDNFIIQRKRDSCRFILEHTVACTLVRSQAEIFEMLSKYNSHE